MIKLNSNALKQVIIDRIRGNPGVIKNLWSLEDRSSIDEEELLNIKIWKRTSKESVGGNIVRYFAPSNSSQPEVADQVSVEITTDLTDQTVLKVLFEG